MLSVNKINGADGEYEISLSGRPIGHIQECDGGVLDVSFYSKRNENALLYVGVAKNFETALVMMVDKAKDIQKKLKESAKMVEDFGYDIKRVQNYSTMKIITDAIEYHKKIIDDYAQYWYNDLNYVIQEEEE